MIKTYYLLTKPGIILGNLITVSAGFILASKGHLDGGLFLATVLGLGLIIASACVFNNYIDRDIDKLMSRTKNRALVRGLVSGKNAIIFALLLGVLGVVTLAIFTNYLALMVALVGFFFYVVMYSVWKRRSSYGTIIGAIAGAVPPVVGYCAVSNRFNGGAAILFLILVLWQMPHFFAIAIYRFKDYEVASIPVLPVKKGLHFTKLNMIFYILAFIVAASLLYFFDYAGLLYLSAALLVGFLWLRLGVKGLGAGDDIKWARQMFGLSLVVITTLCVALSLDVTIKYL